MCFARWKVEQWFSSLKKITFSHLCHCHLDHIIYCNPFNQPWKPFFAVLISMSKDSREITRTTRLPAWPGLSSRRGSRIFYWGPKRFNLYNRWFSPGRRSNSPSCASTHAVSFYLDWAFHPWSIITILLLLIILLVCAIKRNCHWKEHQASERFWRLRETFCWSSLLRSHPNRWVIIIVMEGSNLYNSVIIVMGHCHGSSLSWRGQIYITGSWLLATSPCHENHPSLAEGDTKTFRIHNFFH